MICFSLEDLPFSHVATVATVATSAQGEKVLAEESG